MSGPKRRPGARVGAGWIAASAVALIVTSAGFAVGIFAGLTWEEPGLVIGWLSGDTDGIEWRAETAGEPESIAAEAAKPPDVAAPPPLGAGDEKLPPAPVVRAAPEKRKNSRPPAPPAPSVASVRTPAAPGEAFAVQVGAFAERSAADVLVSSLRSAGFPVYLSAGESGARWRVRVGPHSTRAAAENAAARLKSEQKLPTWVLSEDS